MHPKLEQKLRETYPLLMHQASDSPFAEHGIECGSGWYPVIHELMGLLDDNENRTGRAPQISQLKEKFGTLRLYCDLRMTDLEQDVLELVVEYLSSVTCDVCGEPGLLGSHDDLLATRCQKHREWGLDYEAIDEEVCEKYLSYERQGLSTQDVVYIFARRSDHSERVCVLSLYYFPDRLVSLRDEPLMGQLELQDTSGSVRHMREVIDEMEAGGIKVVGSADGSEIATEVLNG